MPRESPCSLPKSDFLLAPAVAALDRRMSGGASGRKGPKAGVMGKLGSKRRPVHHAARGSTLIEVAIAASVMVIGLLGMRHEAVDEGDSLGKIRKRELFPNGIAVARPAIHAAQPL